MQVATKAIAETSKSTTVGKGLRLKRTLYELILILSLTWNGSGKLWVLEVVRFKLLASIKRSRVFLILSFDH